MSLNTITAQRYFTQEHDWIDFKGAVADVGVGKFKLTGFKAIDKIVFADISGYIEAGQLIASVYYKDYQIDLNMPVAGKIAELNGLLVNGEMNRLLPDGACWLVRIIPAKPYDRNGLVPPKEYGMNGKNKHAKS
ncbi:hypothetical protein [Taibaiella soli]|uniref:Glycine cleavage system protein H n=1 Tax=Taibaiella soli TaxID=1649169 RepID=A0A2W2AKH5_9BACT|nr:hypothetical protein [Taibaiella soli]PZF72760.1 hypothetical protein DN068_12945 [Taibaiella soli]